MPVGCRLAQLGWLQVYQWALTEQLLGEWLFKHLFEFVPASTFNEKAVYNSSVFVWLDLFHNLKFKSNFVNWYFDLSGEVLQDAGKERLREEEAAEPE